MNTKEKIFLPGQEEIGYRGGFNGVFFASLPLPLCLVDLSGVIINANKAFEILTGYCQDNLLHKKIDLFLEKKSGVIAEIFHQEVIENKKISFFTKKGKKIVSLFSVPEKDFEGEITGYFLVFLDLDLFGKAPESLENKVKERTRELERTQRALMNMLEDVEEARKKAEEEKSKTLAIINNFTDGLLVFDKEERALLLNPRAEDFLNIKWEEVVGKSLSQLIKIPFFPPIVKALKRKKRKAVRQEFKINENLILEISSVLIKKAGESIGDLVILHDITREKLIEKLKTEFVSLSAHQLRTPLSAIKWTLKMVLDGDLGKINKEEREFLIDAYKSNERMINLVNSLLNVSRIEEGRYIFNLSLISLNILVRRVVNSYREEAKNKNILLRLKRSKEHLPRVMADEEKMQIVVDNLLKNALKYTPSGGKIIISLEREKRKIRFSIKDTGVGIPANQQKRIFTKFFRANNVRKMDTVGSGLGLYIIKNIINAHHGRIWFESEEGKGTTFFFTLPIKKA